MICNAYFLCCNYYVHCVSQICMLYNSIIVYDNKLRTSFIKLLETNRQETKILHGNLPLLSEVYGLG